ncbi:MAG TPA: fructosamine kinase family protein [Gammaproteobacteria bacterium]|nr:fructosamine kinase family protein [Gammaproteobacteria bacterium]
MGSRPSSALQERVEAAFAAQSLGTPVWRALGAGVGGERWRLDADGGSLFLKTGDADILAAEADGLKALAAAKALRVPAVYASGTAEREGYLLMEWLPLVRNSAGAAARLGEALARQHLMRRQRFGWPRSNFIGATPQFNRESEDWIGFFREQRLGFQLRLAAEDGHRGELQDAAATLVAGLPKLFAGYTPHPALLHGDLWSGNWGVLVDGGPAVFDPAVYCGDRESDLAMTELFGGFPAEFYAAYRLHAPLDPGYAVRRDLYQLYHVLNHLNLFGEGYLGQAQGLFDRLNAELR